MLRPAHPQPCATAQHPKEEKNASPEAFFKRHATGDGLYEEEDASGTVVSGAEEQAWYILQICRNYVASTIDATYF